MTASFAFPLAAALVTLSMAVPIVAALVILAGVSIRPGRWRSLRRFIRRPARLARLARRPGR